MENEHIIDVGTEKLIIDLNEDSNDNNFGFGNIDSK